MIVVDANAMVMALVDSAERGDAARAAMLADNMWVAPAHLPLEVLRVLGRAVREHRLAADDGDAALQALIAMQVEYVGFDSTVLQAIWAIRHNISSYDAAYLVVAAMYDVQLVTFDARLARAAEQVRPDIRVQLL